MTSPPPLPMNEHRRRRLRLLFERVGFAAERRPDGRYEIREADGVEAGEFVERLGDPVEGVGGAYLVEGVVVTVRDGTATF